MTECVCQVVEQRITSIPVPRHLESGADDPGFCRLLQCKRTVVNNCPAVVEQDRLVVAEMDLVEYEAVHIQPVECCAERPLFPVAGNHDMESQFLNGGKEFTCIRVRGEPFLVEVDAFYRLVKVPWRYVGLPEIEEEPFRRRGDEGIDPLHAFVEDRREVPQGVVDIDDDLLHGALLYTSDIPRKRDKSLLSSRPFCICQII